MYICGKVNRIMDSGKERAEAFEKVFREWYPRLCAYAATIVRDGEEARDIVSQVFLRLWEKERNLEWGPGVRPYLFQCVYNAALNFIRAEKVRCRFFEFLRRDMEEGEEPAVPQVSLDELVLLTEQRERLARVWVRLTEEEQLLLEGKYILGYEDGELAGMLGCKKDSVRMKLTRARRRALRLMLEEGGGQP